jgi:hypothetical protein
LETKHSGVIIKNTTKQTKKAIGTVAMTIFHGTVELREKQIKKK